jgi:branched-chain amino acid transport system substrate-binding protein
MRRLAALAALAVLAGCGSERGAITAGGRVAGENLTVYTSLPDPGKGVGRDMLDAAKLAIAQAGGEVGELGINFVSVDEGSVGVPAEPVVPATAARTAIHDPQVIAVIGGVRSDAAMTTVPLFNAAGVLHVSPGAGYAGFAAPVAPTEPERWYPSGRRTFARMIGDDLAQAGALLRAAGGARAATGSGPGAVADASADSGSRRVAVESEPGRVAEELVDALREADAGDPGVRLVDDVAQADAVIYAGSHVGAAAVAAERLARAAAALVFPDELTRAGLAGRLTPAARRRAVFASSAPEPGSTPELRAFEDAFEDQFERPPDPYAVLAWQATRRVLEAIGDAGRRANLRRVVVERYLALPPPEDGFTAFRVRDGRREYLAGV